MQQAELEQKLGTVPLAPVPTLPPPSSNQTTQTKTDDATMIQKLEQDVVTYKAIADKAKERLDEACKAADQREVALRKTIAEQNLQLRDADAKVTTAVSSIQDIATTQIAAVTKELKEMQTTSAMFLQKFEKVETEHSRLYKELLDHQMATTLEREAEHKKHIHALDDAHVEFSHEVDKITAEIEARVQSMNTTHEVVAAQLRLELEQTKQDNLALQALHDERENRTNTLVMKQCQKLNRKIDETLITRWKQWSAQATELQVLRADDGNCRKEGRGFYKMDGTSISMI